MTEVPTDFWHVWLAKPFSPLLKEQRWYLWAEPDASLGRVFWDSSLSRRACDLLVPEPGPYHPTQSSHHTQAGGRAFVLQLGAY